MVKHERNNLEISVEVTVVMEHTDKNKHLPWHKILVNEHYKETANRDFEDATASILEGTRLDIEDTETDTED